MWNRCGLGGYGVRVRIKIWSRGGGRGQLFKIEISCLPLMKALRYEGFWVYKSQIHFRGRLNLGKLFFFWFSSKKIEKNFWVIRPVWKSEK